MTEETVPRQFAAALDRLIAQVKQDRSIVAGVLGGSLSHDTVWARSDIDLVLVTVDDRKVESSSLSLYADGVNVHAILLPRARFRAIVDGSLHNSFMHSFLAKGRLLYTHDPSVADVCARLADMPPDGWRAMLCVEAAQIDQPVALAPGAHWQGWQELRVLTQVS